MKYLLALVALLPAVEAFAASTEVELDSFNETADHVDFEGLGLPYANYSPIHVAGHRFTGSEGALRYADFTEGRNDYALATHGPVERQSITVLLNQAYQLVGLEIGVPIVQPYYDPWSAYVEFYGESGALLGTVSRSGTGMKFTGWLSTSDKIKTLKIVDSSSNGLVTVIDDLRTQSVFPIAVAIDVLPGDEANQVYPNRVGKLPVAILSAADFDATQVNPATLKFGSAEAAPSDPVTVGDVDGEFGHDTTARFRVDQAGIFCNDTEVTLSGSTYAGDAFSGSDSIDATDCEDGSCHVY